MLVGNATVFVSLMLVICTVNKYVNKCSQCSMTPGFMIH